MIFCCCCCLFFFQLISPSSERIFQAVTDQEVQEWVTAIQVTAVLLCYSFQSMTCVTLFSSTFRNSQKSYFCKNMFLILVCFWRMGWPIGLSALEFGLSSLGWSTCQGHSVVHVLRQDT